MKQNGSSKRFGNFVFWMLPIIGFVFNYYPCNIFGKNLLAYTSTQALTLVLQ